MHRLLLPLFRSLFLPTLGLISSLCVGSVNSAVAAILYSQTTPAEPTAAFASSDDSTSAQRIADGFSIGGSEPVTVRSLRFIGGNGQLSVPSDDFRIVFLEDVAGIPGAPIVGGDYKIGPAFSRQPTDGPPLNRATIPLEYIINLPGGITLSPETTYWLSITNSLLPISGWAWARAEGVFDQTIVSTTGSIESGPWDTFESGGMWFELNDQIVPEPSSWLTLLSSIVAMSIPRIRQGKDSDTSQCGRSHRPPTPTDLAS